ncbi:MAG: hypothetical protein AABY22_17220 [Nanoarchaeota archaeon]
MKKPLKEKGVLDLVKEEIRFNKKTITMSKSAWKLIELILSKIVLKPI